MNAFPLARVPQELLSTHGQPDVRRRRSVACNPPREAASNRSGAAGSSFTRLDPFPSQVPKQGRNGGYASPSRAAVGSRQVSEGSERSEGSDRSTLATSFEAIWRRSLAANVRFSSPEKAEIRVCLEAFLAWCEIRQQPAGRRAAKGFWRDLVASAGPVPAWRIDQWARGLGWFLDGSERMVARRCASVAAARPPLTLFPQSEASGDSFPEGETGDATNAAETTLDSMGELWRELDLRASLCGIGRSRRRAYRDWLRAFAQWCRRRRKRLEPESGATWLAELERRPGHQTSRLRRRQAAAALQFWFQELEGHCAADLVNLRVSAEPDVSRARRKPVSVRNPSPLASPAAA